MSDIADAPAGMGDPDEGDRLDGTPAPDAGDDSADSYEEREQAENHRA